MTVEKRENTINAQEHMHTSEVKQGNSHAVQSSEVRSLVSKNTEREETKETKVNNSEAENAVYVENKNAEQSTKEDKIENKNTEQSIKESKSGHKSEQNAKESDIESESQSEEPQISDHLLDSENKELEYKGTDLKEAITYALRMCGIVVTSETLIAKDAKLSLSNLNAYGIKLGYKITPSTDLIHVDSVSLPCVVQFTRGGCGVITEVNDTIFKVWDGSGILTVDKLENEQKNILIANFWKVERIEEEAEAPFLSIAWFMQQISNSKGIYFQVAVATIIINFFTLVVPLLMGIFYDRILPNLAKNSLFVLAVGAILILFVDFILKRIRCYQVEKAALKLERIADPLLFKKILEKRFCSLPQSPGRLTNAIQELSRIKNLFTTQIVLSVIDGLFVFFYLFVIFLNSSTLFLVPLISSILTIVFSGIYAIFLDKNITSQTQLQSRKFSFLNEVFSSLESIKACNGSSNILMLWNTEVYKSSAVSTQYRSTQAKAGYVTAFLGQLNTVGLLIMAFYLISNGVISSGGLLTTMVLSGRVIAIASSTSNILISYIFAKRSYEDIVKILEIETEDSPQANYYPETIAGNIEFKDVSFRYHESLPYAVQDVSFKIKAGERIGIVGATGSGKSTLLKLMTGLASPNSGVITYDNYNLSHLSLGRVRQFMGVIPQSPLLLQGTLESNILMAGTSVTRKDLDRALKVAGLTEMVKNHPMGIKMQIVEGGNNLSRGQRQAICLARALVHNPRVLLFDEPTSSMDNTREELFINSLKKILSNQVMIVVTHRKKILKLVDRVLVVDKGQIKFDGSPEEFLGEGASK